MVKLAPSPSRKTLVAIKKMTKEEYFEKAKFIWQTYVPKSGQAETIQGKLLRAVEKLRDEAQRNGNINWDDGHEILGHYVKNTLIDSNEFDEETTNQIKSDVQRLLIYNQLYLKDDIYDRLTDRIVDWHMKNPDPIPHEHNPILYR